VHTDLARVEHAHAENVAHFAGARADDLGESDQANAHQRWALRIGALGRLLGAQAFVVHRLEHLVERGLVVARVVFKAKGRLVGKLLAPDEVLGADLGLVHAQLLRQHIDHALDQVNRLGDAERAAVGHAAGRLVGIDAIDPAIGAGDVITAGTDVEHAGRKLGRIGTGVKGAMVGDHIGAQRKDFSVGGGRQLAGHVVVAGKAGAGDVLDAVFYPFHGPAQHDGGHDGAHIAGVDRHLVAEAAADVGRDDAHLGLRNARQHGHHGANDVRRLAGQPGREFAAHRIEGSDGAAGLKWARMNARVKHVLLDRDGRAGKGRVGRLLVAGVPGEDVVVVVALAVRAVGLADQVFTQHRRAGLERLERIHHGLQFLVFHLDGFHAVGGGITVFGNHHRHFLHLEVHFFIGQHRLHIAGQRGHPVQLERLEVVGGQHGNHARDLQRFFLVDALDAGMGQGRAHDVHEHHAGQLDVVHVIALALDEARIFLAQARFAHAHQGLFTITCGCVHDCLLGECPLQAATLSCCNARAACCTALTMFW